METNNNLTFADFVSFLNQITNNWEKHCYIIKYCKDYDDFNDLFLIIIDEFFDKETKKEFETNEKIKKIFKNIYTILILDYYEKYGNN